MVKLIVKWHDYPVDDDDVKDELYEEAYDCESFKEAAEVLSKLDGSQYNGYELHSFTIVG